MDHNYYVYIVTNTTKKVLYTGVTNNLQKRIAQHYLNRGSDKTFAGKNYCYYLLYYERFDNIGFAIQSEKTIKGWTREKKIALIKVNNPEMKFLNSEIYSKGDFEEIVKALQISS